MQLLSGPQLYTSLSLRPGRFWLTTSNQAGQNQPINSQLMLNTSLAAQFSRSLVANI
jgi:hypothetical protein